MKIHPLYPDSVDIILTERERQVRYLAEIAVPKWRSDFYTMGWSVYWEDNCREQVGIPERY